MKRMDRDQFFGKLATFDDKRLKKALWNLYWRGSSTMRERIEAELDPDQGKRKADSARESVDPEWICAEVRDFVALARSGGYLAGDRRVSPRERTRWRFTFQRLATDSRNALRADPMDSGAAALELLIDLACEMRGYDYFHSDDPIAAARFVVSDAVALLWRHVQEGYGFVGFAQRAAPQLIRWESRYGWTRRGDGGVSEKETSLARQLAGMFQAPDMWVHFTDHYLEALDQVAGGDAPRPNHAWSPTGSNREQRTADLAEWHLLLFESLVTSDAENQLDRLVRHPALGGPELGFLQARLAYQRDDVSSARDLMQEALQRLPGHQQFLDFATEIGAPLPPRARHISEQRPR